MSISTMSARELDQNIRKCSARLYELTTDCLAAQAMLETLESASPTDGTFNMPLKVAGLDRVVVRMPKEQVLTALKLEGESLRDRVDTQSVHLGELVGNYAAQLQVPTAEEVPEPPAPPSRDPLGISVTAPPNQFADVPATCPRCKSQPFSPKCPMKCVEL